MYKREALQSFTSRFKILPRVQKKRNTLTHFSLFDAFDYSASAVPVASGVTVAVAAGVTVAVGFAVGVAVGSAVP